MSMASYVHKRKGLLGTHLSERNTEVPNKPQRQIHNIQYLRGVAALAVLLYHMQIWERKSFPGQGMLPEAFAVGDAGVDLFFVISGFIMVLIRPLRVGNFLEWRKFLSDRFSRIYPTYWIVSLALLPLWLLRPSLFNNYCGNQMDIARSFLLLPQEFTPLIAVGWTLIHEVYFYLIVSFGLLLQYRGRWVFGLAWFLIVAVGFSVPTGAGGSPPPLVQLVFSPFSLTFLFGYFTGLIHPFMRKVPPAVWWVVLLFGIGSLIFGRMQVSSVGVYPDNNSWLRLMAFGMPCALIFAAAVALQQQDRMAFYPLLLLGDASYALYLIHLPIVAGFYAVASKLGAGSAIELLITSLLCLLSCLLAAGIFHKVIEIRMIEFSRFILRKILRCSAASSG
jgi:exopolysaccharide production protein ExoZ